MLFLSFWTNQSDAIFKFWYFPLIICTTNHFLQHRICNDRGQRYVISFKIFSDLLAVNFIGLIMMWFGSTWNPTNPIFRYAKHKSEITFKFFWHRHTFDENFKKMFHRQQGNGALFEEHCSLNYLRLNTHSFTTFLSSICCLKHKIETVLHKNFQCQIKAQIYLFLPSRNDRLLRFPT